MTSLEKRVRSLELFREDVESRGVYLGKANPSTLQVAEKLHGMLKRSERTVKRSNSNPDDFKKMEKAVVRPPDPPQQTVPIVKIVQATSNLVWPALKEWLLSKDSEGSRKSKFGNFLRLIDAKNTRQALFDRDKKAEKKYGTGLSFDTEVGSFEKSVQKLSDSVYFLFKTANEAKQLAETNPNEYKRQLILVTDLYNILGSLVAELK